MNTHLHGEQVYSITSGMGSTGYRSGTHSGHCIVVAAVCGNIQESEEKIRNVMTAVPRSSAGALCPWIQKPLAAGASTEEKMLVLAVIQGRNSFWNSLQCVSGTF